MAFFRYVFSLVLLLISLAGFSQDAILFGRITDEQNKPVVEAAVAVIGGKGTTTDENGFYELTLKPGTLDITVSHLNYDRKTLTLKLTAGEKKELNFRLNASQRVISEVEITSERYEGTSTISIDPEIAKIIATPGDPFMALVKAAALGLASNNELSSGYSVRGGNFDENLIYVNDVEIYRPFLARSGQQEGLSFVNSDMVENVAFSSGGYEARYGDKMSSVLDVTYKRPTRFRASVSGGLLGGTLHVEDATLKKRLRYVTGLRFRSNNYILRALDTKGEYKPFFVDWQGYVEYSIRENLEISALGMYSLNSYNFVPQNRQTSFGTVNQAYSLRVFFEGREVTRFRTGLGALTLNYKPIDGMSLKLIGSFTDTRESERFDVLGQYFLGELDNNLGSETFGQTVNETGVGSYLNHARNYLDGRIINIQHKGTHTLNDMVTFRWGAGYNKELIDDRIREWNAVDSTGYFLPYFGPQDTASNALPYFLKSTINLNNDRFTAYYENAFTFRTADSTRILLNVGVRAQYFSFNNEFFASPRLSLGIIPNWKRKAVFRVAGGLYYQQLFYREYRNLFGQVNTDIKAQRSVHAIVGFDYVFKIWKRPFKFTTEAYYKYMDRLIPYEVDNIRLRYYAENNAKGFAAGIDFKINGEFVKGVESWASLSIMGTQEDILNDFFYQKYDINGNKVLPGSNAVAVDSSIVFPGYIPRPMDQRVNFAIFFQDNIPKLPDFKVNVTLVLGTGMPYGPPSYDRFRDTLRMPFYRRVDIGFSYQLLRAERKIKKKTFLNYFRSAWIGVDVFNLLGINNTVSYLWIRDTGSRVYSVPTYLTPRLINARFVIDF
ncbi:MAG: TonB-dependent receptor [Flavobacteriales bacterium]|nr:TonB-dependent receptor [Flavobacteriales bacterium]